MGRQSENPGGSKVRERLLEVGVEFFARKGYAATNVREIVEAAGVTKPVLYYYFGNKEGLYLEILRQAFTMYQGTVEEALAKGGSVTDRILRISDSVLGLILEHLDVIKIFHSVYYGPPQGAPFFDFEVVHSSFRELIARLVEEGMANGELRRADVADVTWAIIGALEIVQEIHLCHPELAPGREGLQRVLKVMFRGISTKPNAFKE